MQRIHTYEGFTLVELMISVLMSSLIMGAVYMAYTSNERVHSMQQQTVEMQQNIRAGSEMLFREIKSAGYDPVGGSGAGIVAARPDAISFTIDANGDNDTADAGENLAYNISTVNGIPVLRRSTSPNPIAVNLVGVNHYEAPAAGQQTAAEYIEALEFFYTLQNGATTTDATGSEDQIVVVNITMIARSPIPDPEFINTVVYTGASGQNFALSGANPPNDNFRRRMITQTIKLRNMGLN